VAVFSGSDQSKIRTEENIATVERQLEDKPQLSLRQLSQQCQLVKELFERMLILDDSVTAERYRNNILDVFITQLQLAQGYF
jgi:hypothetical protein